ncbi:MAG: T9SS type A sorting domain-containing protein [Fibromonadaceae bacterium]|jgi:endo-1,4-beta-D-glucanase Y|nr:T9SS type A sorting domain-containing protein [Fibromonadaceae bacterium]
MLKKITAILALATLLAYSAVKFPYPQRKQYGNGTINVANSTADTDLKAKFENYIKDFYVTGTCGGTACARIKFFDPDKQDDANYTVSEGIGYAMLLAVYFSGTTSYQDHFDKLWAYYKANTNSNGVMNWKISGFSGATGQNGATDAEFDVALALAMARYQFDDTKYETAAKDLIGKIWASEMESNGLHKPGDAWNGNKNPSYVAPAAFEIFKDLGNSSNWASALTANYTLLKNNQNKNSTGLVSGWSDASGNPNTCTNSCGINEIAYDQDAVRAPWRWATANAWFGHADAKTLINKLGTWVNGKNPGDIKGPIKLDGTMGTNSNASYYGSLMCALTNNSSYQSKLNSFFSTMMGQTERANTSYFNQSMLLLTGLLVSGNMPNLKACAAGNCGTNMSAVGGGDGNSTTLDRLAVAGSDTEDNRSLSALWEAWYAYTDKEAGYKDGKPDAGQANSKITNTPFKAKDENDNCKEIDSYRVVLQDGNDWAVKISSYTLDQGTYKYEPFVALGLDARKNGKPTNQGGYDLSKCTGGFSYSYKGPPHKFKALSSELTEGAGFDHFKNITTASTSSWTTITIPPTELEQPTGSWVTEVKPFNLAKVRGWGWELLGAATSGGTGLSPATGNFAIKDFKCLGKMDLPTQQTPKCGNSTPPVTTSSSSRATGTSSSSSVGSTGGSSSSRVGSSSSANGTPGGNSSSSSANGTPGGNSSSSEIEDTPIISISGYAANNGALAINNGVNLQVSKAANVEVFSLNGKSIRKHEFSSGTYSIMLNDLPKGLYIVKVQFGSQKEILRVPVR